MLVHIILGTSKGSAEPGHLHSFARQNVEVDKSSDPRHIARLYSQLHVNPLLHSNAFEISCI